MVRKVNRKQRNNRIEDDEDVHIHVDTVAEEQQQQQQQTTDAAVDTVAEAETEQQVADDVAPEATSTPEAAAAVGSSVAVTSRDELGNEIFVGDSTTLTEEQMKSNIRVGARGLRELVDKYSEQHRVMQEEVAEAIIRDVQEQNQLHKLTATVLRQQQAALSNPEYTRWAYMNKKGEFSEEEDLRRVVEARAQDRRVRRAERRAAAEERGEAMEEGASASEDIDEADDAVSNKSKPRSVASSSGGAKKKTKSSDHLSKKVLTRAEEEALIRHATGREDPSTGLNKFDRYVSEENKWMREEVDAFNARRYHQRRGGGLANTPSSSSSAAASSAPPPPPSLQQPIVINLDGIHDKATLSFIKGNKSNIGGGDGASSPAVAAPVSKVPLPATSTLSPILSAEQKATKALKGFFGETIASTPSSQYFYVPFLNGSVLWPLREASSPNAAEEGTSPSSAAGDLVKSFAAGSSSTTMSGFFNYWLCAQLQRWFGGKHADDDAASLADRLVTSLINGDGQHLLRDEGNLLVLVPFNNLSTTSSSSTSPPSFLSYVTCRAVSFKGIVKAVEVMDTPNNSSVLCSSSSSSSSSSASSSASIATTLKKAMAALSAEASSATVGAGARRPTNAVRTFIIPLAAFGGVVGGADDDDNESALPLPLLDTITMVDARVLSPAIPFRSDYVDAAQEEEEENTNSNGATRGGGSSSGAAVPTASSSSNGFTWTDLCGLARVDVESVEKIVLKMAPIGMMASSSPTFSALEPYDRFSALTFPKRVDVEPTTRSAPNNTAAAAVASGDASSITVDGQTSTPLPPPTHQQSSKSQPIVASSADLEKKSNAIEITPAMLAGMSVGFTGVAVCCAAAGYWLAKRK